MANRILVIDDSALSRKRFLSKPLKEAGFDVTEASNGQEGLDAYEAGSFDCIITDLLMPVMDGFELLNTLKERGCTTPVIVASADIQETSQQKISDAGAAGFLNKPYKAEELLEVVGSVITVPAKG